MVVDMSHSPSPPSTRVSNKSPVVVAAVVAKAIIVAAVAKAVLSTQAAVVVVLQRLALTSNSRRDRIKSPDSSKT